MRKIWQSLPLLGKTPDFNPKTSSFRRRKARRLVVHLQPPYFVLYFLISTYSLSAMLVVGLSLQSELFYDVHGFVLLIPLVVGIWIVWRSFSWSSGLVSLTFDSGVWLLVDSLNQEYEVKIHKSTFVSHFLLVMPLAYLDSHNAGDVNQVTGNGLSEGLGQGIIQEMAKNDTKKLGKYTSKSLILSPYWINPKEYRRLCALLWTSHDPLATTHE